MNHPRDQDPACLRARSQIKCLGPDLSPRLRQLQTSLISFKWAVTYPLPSDSQRKHHHIGKLHFTRGPGQVT